MRIGKQCRERWQNYLRPNIMKNAWTEEEDKLLISLHQQFGNKWADIARRMPGRTENNIKNHWNATKRKQFLNKNHEKTKNPSSLLKDYITSITSSSSPNHQINIQQSPPPVVDHTTTDSEVGYKPAELAPDERDVDFDFDDVSSQLVDELVFDPTKEMDFLKLFCQ
ncbi:transcription factor MYB98-like [Lactuca sativa]|uniref:transcription factor MYB98-like n=1 Tax=Lactuca sativa TaxID=4236 RepID=UPI0022AF664A|nr:transcription factor MYB98-like [Lactuca sativa]